MNNKRWTTDKPGGMVEMYRNTCFIKNKEVYLREQAEDGGDISLVEYCAQQCKEQCNNDYSEIPVEEFGEYMDCDCPIARLYWISVGAAELREKLSLYENSGFEPHEILPRK
jgi:hypothetical protein